jgi:hypothetical protein
MNNGKTEYMQAESQNKPAILIMAISLGISPKSKRYPVGTTLDSAPASWSAVVLYRFSSRPKGTAHSETLHQHSSRKSVAAHHHPLVLEPYQRGNHRFSQPGYFS